jgi:HEAT repeat protein
MVETRETVKKLLREKQYQEIVRLTEAKLKTVRLIRSLLYEEEAIIRWRAVTLMGKLAAAKPKLVKKDVERLLWSLNDEAGFVGRGAPETIGEIGRTDLQLVKNAVKVVFEYLKDPETCRPPNRNIEIVIGVLWAIGRVGSGHTSFVKEILPTVETFIDDPDPGIRAHAAWCLGQTGAREYRNELIHLVKDKKYAMLYEDEELQEKTVGKITSEALDKMGS